MQCCTQGFTDLGFCEIFFILKIYIQKFLFLNYFSDFSKVLLMGLLIISYDLFCDFNPCRGRGLHLGLFGCVCLSVCLSAQNFSVFLRNRLSDREKILTIGATTQVECYIYNYDIIGRMVW